MQIASGAMLTQALGVAAQLAIADLLKDGAKAVDELAKAVEAHPRSRDAHARQRRRFSRNRAANIREHANLNAASFGRTGFDAEQCRLYGCAMAL